MTDEFMEKFVEGPQQDAPAGEAAMTSIKDQAIGILMETYDPEIPVNIYELGLIYGVEADEEAGKVDITMTLTTPMCPVANSMPGEIQEKVAALDGVNDVTVDLVWEPPWDMSMLSDAAKLELGMM